MGRKITKGAGGKPQITICRLQDWGAQAMRNWRKGITGDLRILLLLSIIHYMELPQIQTPVLKPGSTVAAQEGEDDLSLKVRGYSGFI